jgi:hypothetical protein
MPTHRTTCRVIYGDTDNMGQAYYGNYFRKKLLRKISKNLKIQLMIAYAFEGRMHFHTA